MLVSVLVPTPHYAKIDCLLTYESSTPLTLGSLVRVPLGRRVVLGIVWEKEDLSESSVIDQSKIKSILEVLELAPLGKNWRELMDFCATYYQRSRGEVALNALPSTLKKMSATLLKRRVQELSTIKDKGTTINDKTLVKLTNEQDSAILSILSNPKTYLLFGATGSGKTEVYMQCVAKILASKPNAQVLIMVPEINLTPQLQERFSQRFSYLGSHAVVSLHSAMTDLKRCKNWMLAHSGQAKIILGTRLSIFASLPNLSLIVVDEEHDQSYKSDQGARYSARDLAVYLAKKLTISVVLGSATPSLESWYLSRPVDGRYERLYMLYKIGSAGQEGEGENFQFPELCLVNMHHQPKRTIISASLLAAIQARIQCGEQSMLLLNQRGYAPVLSCKECDWKSGCPNCNAFQVFHQADRTLRCHHCGLGQAVMRACPGCGNPDIIPVGLGTEQLEELLHHLLRACERKNGGPVRVLRIDADSTRHKGRLEELLSQVHSSEVDIIIGTQMIAKGHDFRNISLVAAIQPDGALFSYDYRASERLFALLLQASGRAGRDARLSHKAQMWVQTFQPENPLFDALKKHDYPSFSEHLLSERAVAGLPPFSSQALLRAEAKSQIVAQKFLNQARRCAVEDLGNELSRKLAKYRGTVTVMPAIPMSMARVANVERAQMLVESLNRKALQQFLHDWREALHQQKLPGLIRWAIDVDPLAI